jgi:hypothetical protein
MIPDYQALMRPVLECAVDGEVRIGEVIDQLAATGVEELVAQSLLNPDANASVFDSHGRRV